MKSIATLAILFLLATPVALLTAQEAKTPSPVPDEQTIRTLVGKLSSQDAAERDKTTEELKALPPEALPPMKKILESTTDPEAKWRLELTIKTIEDRQRPPVDDSAPNPGAPALPADVQEMVNKAEEIRAMATGGGMANPQEMMKKAMELADLAKGHDLGNMPPDAKKQMDDARKRFSEFSGRNPGLGKDFDKKKFDKAFERRAGLGGTFEELPAADPAKLGTGAGEGAVRIKTVVAGGLGDKAGLKIGDVVVEFDGKKLPATKPLDALRKLIVDAKANTDIPLIVLREGKRVELKIKWVELE
ncbi:MAG: hypothetical protein A2Z34_00805 [Planctomycetes bacterium RBG_16_59_8]|nr:MAG: hypothetical protein A2Z34_00805 [Planctomycetes bacterium RBG_16_59_8]